MNNRWKRFVDHPWALYIVAVSVIVLGAILGMGGIFYPHYPSSFQELIAYGDSVYTAEQLSSFLATLQNPPSKEASV